MRERERGRKREREEHEDFTNLRQKFCNISIRVSLRSEYHAADAVQAMTDTGCGWLYSGSWCADTLCTASLPE